MLLLQEVICIAGNCQGWMYFMKCYSEIDVNDSFCLWGRVSNCFFKVVGQKQLLPEHLFMN